MYKLNPDGESCQYVTGMGKKWHEEKLAENAAASRLDPKAAVWTDQCPRVRYPHTLYKPSGETLKVENRAEENRALELGWENAVYGTVRELYSVGDPPKPTAPEATSGNVDLALKLIEMGQQLAEMRAQLAARESEPAPKRPSRGKPFVRKTPAAQPE